MASRWFNQFRLSLEKQVVDLWCNFTVGGIGAPTLVSAASKGIKSVVRNSAGKYTITLSDSYYGFLQADIKILNATAPAAPLNFVVSQAVTSSTTPVVVIQFTNTAGAATDPGSGESVFLKVSLKNSSAY